MSTGESPGSIATSLFGAPPAEVPRRLIIPSNYIPKVEPAFELRVRCGEPRPLGRMRGGNAMMIPIIGGTVSGELSGEVMPGGADWAIRGDDGVSMVDARYAIQASDGTIIQVFNTGAVLVDRSNVDVMPTVLTTPRFVAPEGIHGWLNRTVFVGTLGAERSGDFGIVLVSIFKLV